MRNDLKAWWFTISKIDSSHHTANLGHLRAREKIYTYLNFARFCTIEGVNLNFDIKSFHLKDIWFSNLHAH